MSTSGSTDFSVTRSDLCTEALTLLGVRSAGETISAEDMETVVSSLNLMVKSWQAQGVFQWPLTEDSFPLVSATASYLFGTGGTKTYVPVRIMSVRYARSTTSEIPLERMSREEYFDLPDKTSVGQPNGFYYDKQRASGRLYFWPVLDGTDTVKYTYVRAFEDFDANEDEPDFPQEWFETIAYNLALRIAPKFRVTAPPEVVSLAVELFQTAKGWDRDMAPVRIMPHSQWV